MTSLSLQSFGYGTVHAEEIARNMQIPFGKIACHPFPDGEVLVTVPPATETTIVYCPLDHPNQKLIELGLAAEALRRNGAKRLVLVAPYLCYMRQDAAFHPGEAIGQRTVANYLAGLFDRIITVDAHLHRIQNLSAIFPYTETTNLTAASAIAHFVKAKELPASTLVAGPDFESKQWVDLIAKALNFESLVGRKQRLGDRSVEIQFEGPLLGDRTVLIVDDIVSTGRTMIEAIQKLKRAGADRVFVALTHALFSDEALTAMWQAGARGIWSTTSVPHPTNKISLCLLLAEALQPERRTDNTCR